MAGVFGSPKSVTKSTVPEVTATPPAPAPIRSSTEVASMAASQTDRFTRRRGRAMSMLTGGSATGGMTAGRMLGSVART